MSAGLGMELVGKMEFLEAIGEAAVGAEQGFVVARGYVYIRRPGGVRSLDQHERIKRTPGFTSPGSKDGPKPHPFSPAEGIEAAMNGFDGGAECADECEELGASQCQLDGGEPSHRNSDDGSIVAVRCRRESRFHV